MGAIRLLLALSVIISHAEPSLGGKILVGGSNAVRLFFIISGFYMALILPEKYGGEGGVRVFYVNRLLRLIPTYYCLLLVPIAFAVCSGLLGAGARWVGQAAVWEQNWHSIPSHLRLIAGVLNLTIVGQEWLWSGSIVFPSCQFLYTGDVFGENRLALQHLLILPPSWTLALELEFYLLAPWFVRMSNRSLLLISLLSSVIHPIADLVDSRNPQLWSGHTLPGELVFFLAGMLVCRFRERLCGVFRNESSRSIRFVPQIALVAVLLVYPLLRHMPLAFPAVAAICCLLLPAVFEASKANRVDRAWGELSYPVYLGHWLVIGLWFGLCRRVESLHQLSSVANVLAITFLSFVVAVLLRVTVEVPVDRFRQTLAKRTGGRSGRDRE